MSPFAKTLHLHVYLAVVAIFLSATASAQTPVNNSVQGVTSLNANRTVPPTPPAAAPALINAPDLKIGSGDLLRVGIFGIPDFSPDARVDGNGDISLQPLDSVHVAGLTPRGAELFIREQLMAGGYFKDPRVSVFVKEYATQGVSVLGEVQKPGVYTFQGERRLFDMISAAGGLTARAGTKIAVLHRDSPQQPMMLAITRDPQASAASNVDILPGDIITVSTAGVVYVVGDVAKPSGFIMDNEKLTVLQAVALAGGVNNTAALNDAKVIRRQGDGQHEVPIKLKKILQSKVADVALQPEDILFVPSSATKSAAYRGISAIVSAATGVAIFSTPRR